MVGFFLLCAALFGLFFGLLAYALVKAHRKQSAWIAQTRRALAEGEPGTAVITSMGQSSLGRLVATLALDVQPERAQAFSATVEAYVPPYAAAALSPGKRVAVRCIAAERAVAIDYPAMGYEAPPGW